MFQPVLLQPIDYLVLGHNTCDMTPDGFRLGGTATYATLTARALGLRVGVVTSWGAEIPLGPLSDIPLINYPAEIAPTFENIQTANGRIQYVHHNAPPINLNLIPDIWRTASIVHMGPILQEVEPNLVRHFPTALIGVTPQGWLRSWDGDGRVHRCEWPEGSFVLQRAMLLMQQGAFAPVNMFRAFRLNKDMGDYAALIDFFSGVGRSHAILDARSGIPGVKQVNDLAAEASNWVVDRFPRRAAFLYEARKLGYDRPGKVVSLLTDPAHVDDLRRVSTRTKNAMVDYDNLSRFERDVMTNLIFVYPWLKGATYWTGRFVKDHPVQSMAYAALVAWQQERIKDAFPDGYPGYLKWYMPVGKVERNGEEYPYGPRMDQAFTFLTPLDIGSDVTGRPAAKKRAAPARAAKGAAKVPAKSAAKGAAAVHTMNELMAYAYALEVEAGERYAEFADAMETHNNREVAELFRKLARIEHKHAEQIFEEMGWTAAPTPPSSGYKWQGPEGPETADFTSLHYLMQPYHALEIALINENARSSSSRPSSAARRRRGVVLVAALAVLAVHGSHLGPERAAAGRGESTPPAGCIVSAPKGAPPR